MTPRLRRAQDAHGTRPVTGLARKARPVADLQGRLIRLRPVRGDEIYAAWQGLALQDEAAHPRRGREAHRPEPAERFRRRLQRSGRLWRGLLDLAIEHEGGLIGTIQARTGPAQTLPAGSTRSV
jgi:hypothetical protein